MQKGGRQDTWIRCDTLLTPFQRYEGCLIRVVEGKVAAIVPASSATSKRQDDALHEPGTIVAPGLIDVHVHGAHGRDLMDGTLDSLQAVSSTLARHGTTSFLATTMSAPDADLTTALAGFARQRGHIEGGAVPLGIHLEGPFLNPVRKGTHNSRYLTLPSIRVFERLVKISDRTIRKVTVAPELDHALDLIRAAAGMGIRISMGHSDATAKEAEAAVDAGATQATHVFNAMRPFHQREPGILGLVLTDDRISAEIIADGVHVHAAALRLLLRVKGVKRTMLITDGLSAVDMPEGSYPLGDKLVMVKDGACRDPDGTLAGSTLTLDRAVKNLVTWLGVPLQDALIAASASPARSMGQSNKGVIEPGADADLVFFDHELNVRKTMVAGRVVYTAK